MKLRVKEQWDMFLKYVVNPKAPPNQITETRRAFYAGAQAMLRITSDIADASPADPTDADIQPFHELHDELLQFAADVLTGAA